MPKRPPESNQPPIENQANTKEISHQQHVKLIILLFENMLQHLENIEYNLFTPAFINIVKEFARTWDAGLKGRRFDAFARVLLGTITEEELEKSPVLKKAADELAAIEVDIELLQQAYNQHVAHTALTESEAIGGMINYYLRENNPVDYDPEHESETWQYIIHSQELGRQALYQPSNRRRILTC